MNIKEEVNNILNIFAKRGYEASLVGGCIRDIFLGKTPNDWDIATNAKPEVVMKIFPHSIPTGIKHGTVTIIYNNSSYEITTYRIEGNYSNNRCPDSVKYVTDINRDLCRRDFTVNAMAYNLSSGIIDPFNGNNDILNKIIRCVGDPDKRFNEDALRMLRAIRFSCQLNFSIENNTMKAIYKNKNLLGNISKERIQDELCKILLSQNAASGITMLIATGLMEFIIPELISLLSVDKNNMKDHNNNTLKVLNACPAKLEVRLAALLHVINKNTCKTILKGLKFSNEIIDTVCKLVDYDTGKFKYIDKLSIKKLIGSIGKENIYFVLDLIKADFGYTQYVNDFESTINNIMTNEEPIFLKDLRINGSDLINIGFKPGKEIGITLKKLLDIVLSHPDKNTRIQLLNIVKNMKS